LVGMVVRRLMLLLEIPVKLPLERAESVTVAVMEKAVLRFEVPEGGMCQW